MQSAVAVLSVAEGDSATTRLVTLRLACGCVVTRTIAADRLLELSGERRAVGKYPCPERHPVVRPA